MLQNAFNFVDDKPQEEHHGLQNAFNFGETHTESGLELAYNWNPGRPNIPFVDDWVPEDNQVYFRTAKDIITLSLSTMFKINDTSIDIFMMAPKRSYNNEKVRLHTVHYLNYFLNYFDTDKELILIYAKVKYNIDYERHYTEEMFLADIYNNVLAPTIIWKVQCMDIHNFNLDLVCKSKIKESLKYYNSHGRLLMNLSLIFNIIIPLMSHFMSSNNYMAIDDFILKVYDMVLTKFEDTVDMYSKLYETASTTTQKSQTSHIGLWAKQDIRSINATTHTIGSVTNILVNIIPKYEYSKNGVVYNYQSLLISNKYKVEDISYEYAFHPISSSKRDEDQQSELDKFESYLIRRDESLYLQNKMNSRLTIKEIDLLFGPFSDEEIKFYKEQIGEISQFQKELIFNMFYKYFGDTDSIKDNNSDVQFKLLVAAKHILLRNGFKVMPYIISGKINKMVRRKNINKKEQNKILSSPLYEYIQQKYRSQKILDHITNIMATIVSSKFTVIDYEDESIHNTQHEIEPSLICEEVLLFVAQT